MKNNKRLSIPLGMHRSVENEQYSALHPVRDASLTGCKGTMSLHFPPSDIPYGNKNVIFNGLLRAIALAMTFCVLLKQPVYGQASNDWKTTYESITVNLARLEQVVPGLRDSINISITGATLHEFLRAVANSSDINMDISPALTQTVVNNFSNVNIADVLLFLSNQYRLNLTSVGNIISVTPFIDPTAPPVCIVEYDAVTGRLTLESEGETLELLSRKLTLASGFNVIPAPGIGAQKITSFILALPFEEALDKVAYANNLVLKTTETDVYLFERMPERVEPVAQNREMGSLPPPPPRPERTGGLSIRILGNDSLSIHAVNVSVLDIIQELSDRTQTNYMFTALPRGEVSAQMTGVTYYEAVNSILKGSGIVCKKSGSIYIFGAKNTPELMHQSVVQLQYRPVDSIMAIIPKDIQADIQIIEYREQNSLLLSGPGNVVLEAERFIRSIDKRAPVLSIEIIIIDYSGKHSVSTGIELGLGSEPVSTSGVVFPNPDITLSSASINSLINRFNGFGWANIGNVTPNFYASLQALETQGIVKIRSTPVLSTINGHTAELSIGKKEYYVEEQSNIYSHTGTQTHTTRTYHPVTADLSIIITPFVSGDDQITLDIEVGQSDFTERISATAPPGEVMRKFKSHIRVKNGEMILLGGLEENRNDKMSSGTPLLSRIPVIKWLFSSRKEADSKTKLNIFIRPTIIG